MKLRRVPAPRACFLASIPAGIFLGLLLFTAKGSPETSTSFLSFILSGLFLGAMTTFLLWCTSREKQAYTFNQACGYIGFNLGICVTTTFTRPEPMYEILQFFVFLGVFAYGYDRLVKKRRAQSAPAPRSDDE